jgi:repressor of nif and glnA expression
MMDLRFMAGYRTPLFRGVIERGLTDQDLALKLLLDRGLITQQGNDGFVVTEKGRATVKQSP